MRYLDVCAGISASTVAWRPLGWQAAAYSEIEAAPRAILAHHYPDTPLHGDFTTIQGDEYGPIDLLVGGTPCQDFSVAGLRAGLGGDRGNLSLQFLLLAARTRARWVVWENVPGVFSSLSHDSPDPCPPQDNLDGDDGPEDGTEIVVEDEYDADESHALACFLAGLSELGYGVAYRVLDAQFTGVPQRRRRIFAVGYLGDWRRAAAVLFERHSLSGHPAPCREAGKAVAALTSAGVGTCGADDNQGQAGHLIAHAFGGNDTRGPIEVSAALNSHGGPHGRQDFESETFVLMERGRGGEPNLEWRADGTANAILTPNGGRGGLGVGAVCTPFDTTQITSAANYSNPKPGDPCHPLARGQHAPAVAFTCSDQANSFAWERPFYPTLNAQVPNDTSNIQTGIRIGSAVRRLTPRECERLQGFPDDYTLVPHRGKPMADGPRYKALGNSMAVPVMRWIGERIAAVDAIMTERASA